MISCLGTCWCWHISAAIKWVSRQWHGLLVHRRQLQEWPVGCDCFLENWILTHQNMKSRNIHLYNVLLKFDETHWSRNWWSHVLGLADFDRHQQQSNEFPVSGTACLFTIGSCRNGLLVALVFFRISSLNITTWNLDTFTYIIYCSNLTKPTEVGTDGLMSWDLLMMKHINSNQMGFPTVARLACSSSAAAGMACRLHLFYWELFL